MDNKPVKVNEFNGTTIRVDDNGMWNMTDLWKANGSNSNKDLRHWQRNSGSSEFIDTVMKDLDVPKSVVLRVVKGRNSSTWGHPQIALAYAKYLSHDLHMHVNNVFFERIEENNDPILAITRGHQRARAAWKKQGKSDDWIDVRSKSVIATKEDNAILAKHGENKWVHSLCSNAINKEIIGMSAKDFKASNNLPKSAKVPDHLTAIELAQYQLSRMVAMKTIVDKDIHGNKPCADVHTKIASGIVGACDGIAMSNNVTLCNGEVIR